MSNCHGILYKLNGPTHDEVTRFVFDHREVTVFSPTEKVKEVHTPEGTVGVAFEAGVLAPTETRFIHEPDIKGDVNGFISAERKRGVLRKGEALSLMYNEYLLEMHHDSFTSVRLDDTFFSDDPYAPLL